MQGFFLIIFLYKKFGNFFPNLVEFASGKKFQKFPNSFFSKNDHMFL
jgi:hypothetical protein